LLRPGRLRKRLNAGKRKAFFTYTDETVITGEKPAIAAVLPSFLWGAIIGYKLGGLLITTGALDKVQDYLFSPDGSLLLALVCAAAFAAKKWFETNKHKLPAPEKKIVRVWPGDRVGTMTIIAAVAGLIGAKIFDNLENWNRFIQDPWGNLFSRSGLTFYGGLITAAIAL